MELRKNRHENQDPVENGNSKTNGDADVQPNDLETDDLDLVVPEEDGDSPGPSSGDVDLPTPPDGGWGWVVVFASFMIHVIADGVVYSFGIFYVEFLDYFKSGRGATSWVGSLVPGITLASGESRLRQGIFLNEFCMS